MAALLWRGTALKAKMAVRGVAQVGRRGRATRSQDHLAVNAPETEVSTLGSGLRVASENWDSPTATVGLWIDAGSRFETPSNNGTGNFFERMAFKGTQKRPLAELELEVESMGARLNAYTTREQTAFYAKCFSKDIPKAVEILADVIQNCTLGEDEIERERRKILQEIEEMEETRLEEVVHDHLHMMAYQGTPLGYSPVGPTDNIRAISRTDLVEYVSTHFKAPRMVLAAAGGVNHRELTTLAEEHLGKINPATGVAEIPTISKCRFSGGQMEDRDDDMLLAHIAMAVEGPGWADPDNVVLNVASALVGSWDKSHAGGVHLPSRLAAECARDERCHKFQSFHTNYSDTSLWGCYFVVGSTVIENFLYHLQGEWMRLCTNVTDFDVQRARDTLRTNMFLNLGEGTTPVCEEIGRQMLSYGRRIPVAEMDTRIAAVSAADVQEVCMKYIYDRCPVVIGVGPVEQLPDFNRLRSAMYWVRV